MKKILTILTFFLAFTIGASAQESQKDPYKAAQADFTALNAVIPTKKLERDLTEIFYTKHKTLGSQANITAEEKAQLSSKIETRLSEVLSKEQLKKLKANQQLYTKLLN